jgi:predicted transcriptional regulator
MLIPTPEELRAKRESLGIRQAELARRAGISQSMVARIEAGNVDPRVSTLKKIVNVLNASVRPKVTAACVMNRPVISVHPEDSINRAIEIMDRDNISQIPVIEDGVPVGCISETAIVDALNQPAPHRTHSLVRHYMEPGFPTVSPDTDIETVVSILQNNHAVLVMESGKVNGVITKHDLISLIADH